jgi:hypothetical protein
MAEGEVMLRTICRRGHGKEPGGRCKECERGSSPARMPHRLKTLQPPWQ